MTAFGRFDDVIAGRSLVFPGARRILRADTVREVVPVLQAVSDLTEAGDYAYGYVGYEAAPGLDPLLTVVAPSPDQPPLVWFAICDAPATGPVIAPGDAPGAALGQWLPDWGDDDYDAAIGRVLARIAAGDTYQVNLTSRLMGTVAGDPLRFYASLAHRQRGAHAAYLDLGEHVVASASPELFFSWDGSHLVTRPMKGTARRGRTTVEDAMLRNDLLTSEKERAEHIIVVDLLRNDLGRIAETGTVTTPRLGVAERYESVWQLTSDVVARTRAGVTLTDIFRALFPSGSITGAPKRRTMEIVAGLEARPRGVYCGAIGVVSPPGSPLPRARFSVAIRTAVISRATGAATYGVGGGITSGSVPPAERQELQTKSQILFTAYADFDLLETLFCSPVEGLRNLDRHLARMADSADYFGFVFPRAHLMSLLEPVRAAATSGTRVRLTLARSGEAQVTAVELQPTPDRAVRLAIDTEGIDAAERWLFHKTTRRSVYEAAAARHADADDVVLVNGSGCVTETTVASLAARIEGVWFTPPLAAGCLPGVERGRLLENGALAIRDLTVAALRAADELAVISSLRGWRPAVLT